MDVINPRSPKYLVTLACAAGLVLLGGWLIRPRDIPVAPAVPSAAELEQLSRRAERRSLENMSGYFASIARDVETSLAHVRGPGLSAIAWSDAYLLTGPVAVKPGSDLAIVTSAGTGGATADLWGPQLPFTALLSPPAMPGLIIAQRAASLPRPGDWIVAVWRPGEEHTFAAANYRQQAVTTCGDLSVQEVVSSLALTREMQGGGLFDMDGGLLAVILPCGAHVAAVANSGVDRLVARGSLFDQRLLGRFGIDVGRLSEQEQEFFKVATGLLVREVWLASPADTIGLWAGDIITAVGDQPVADITDLRPLTMLADGPIELSVQRGSQVVKLPAPASTETPGTGQSSEHAGLILESPVSSYRIEGVVPGSRAANAGMHAGDRIVRINRAAPRGLAQVRSIVDGRRSVPMLLEVLRDNRRVAIVMP